MEQFDQLRAQAMNRRELFELSHQEYCDYMRWLCRELAVTFGWPKNIWDML